MTTWFLAPMQNCSSKSLQGCCQMGVAKKRPSGLGMKKALFTSFYVTEIIGKTFENR